MESTFNRHANASVVVSSGQETQILFMLNKPVIGDDGSIKIVMQEQALISIPFEYASTLAKALLDNIENHKAQLANTAEKASND